MSSDHSKEPYDPMKWFVGYNLDEVFENDQRRRKEECEAAEKKEKREALHKKLDALRAKEEKKDSASETTKPAGTPPLIIPSYQGLEFEHPIPYKDENKELFYFNTGLAQLRKAGFQRYPRPAEAFSLIIDGLEGKLTGELADVQQNMLESYGEWLSLAVQRKGDTLIASVDPENLHRNTKKSRYELNGKTVHCTDQKEFTIKNQPSQQWINLQALDQDLIQFLYGRTFDQLPQPLREGPERAQLYLPPEGVVRPVARGNLGWFGIDGCDHDYGAARGVRPSANFF